MKTIRTSRRGFLRTAAGAAAAPTVRLPAGTRRQSGRPAERIRIATIGLGQQGFADTRAALLDPEVELAGIADLYAGRRQRAAEEFGDGVIRTADYRELLERREVDAVIVATSDHWHAPICIQALQAGKDVYCEKPMVHSLREGREVLETRQRTDRILQVGSQRTSSPLYRRARRLIGEGAIGPVLLIEAWYRRSSTNGAWQYVVPPDASPRTVDWERFLGPAPRRPFDADRFFRWRNYWDYGTAIAGDLFVHLLTAVHYLCDSRGPVRVAAQGGLRHWKDGREVPDVMLGLYEYPAADRHPPFNVSLRVNFADTVEGSGMRIVGSEGVIELGRRLTLVRRPREQDIRPSISTFPEAMQRSLLEAAEGTGAAEVVESEQTTHFEAPAGPGGTALHMASFLEAVRTRSPVVQDAAFGFRAAAPALLANDSYLERRTLGWDPDSMTVQQP